MFRWRDPLFLVTTAVFTAALAIALFGAISWIGRPFAGFLILENRVVASAGLNSWPATQGGKIYQYEIVEVNSDPVNSIAEIHARVQSAEPGTPITYRLERQNGSLVKTIPTRRFSTLDFWLLFGAYLFDGAILGALALLIRGLRGNDPVAKGAFSILAVAGLWAITAADLYGPYHMFRLHALCEALLFAATIHMALVFPRVSPLARRIPKLIPGIYGTAFALATYYQVRLFDSADYVAAHLLAVTGFGVALIVLIGSQLYGYMRPPSFDARQRVKIVAIGTALALFPQAVLALGSTITGGETPQNVMAFSGMVFPISIGYAVLRHDLLEVDLFLRRTVNYVLLTLVITLALVASIHGLEMALSSISAPTTTLLRFLLTAGCVASVLGLRGALQTAVDKTFFRTAYDFDRTVETTSARLASVVDLEAIASTLRQAIENALHPEALALLVTRDGGDSWETLVGDDLSGSERAEVVRVATRSLSPTDSGDGGLAVPFRVDRRLVAVLSVRRPKSGRLYDGDDRRLLQTMSNQGAVAIENALTLDELRALNRDLEEKVEERTRELREAHAQLVHREKMASVGQFVAGIAHELNNPLNFIQGNLYCLREYMTQIRELIASYENAAGGWAPELREQIASIRTAMDAEAVLADIDTAFEGCAEGVERSTTLVQDLRTFSRADRPELTATNLNDLLDSSLNILRNQLSEIAVEREYSEIPLVHCIGGQISQVFVNVIANAADAMEGRGRLILRSERLGPETVRVVIEDSGPGISADVVERIFDPFFTTKPVGKGTGLGLSISYGVVARHGGSIHVRTPESGGTMFEITLPVKPPSGEAGSSAAVPLPEPR